jgi:hypothetical protein
MNDLATCSYREFRPSMGVPVPISVGVPNEYKRFAACSGLKPFGIFGVHKAESAYTAHYFDRMDAKAPDIAAELKQVSNDNGGQTLVLLCWCNLSSSVDWCHRRIAAAWLELHSGLVVAEFGAVTSKNLYPQRHLFDGKV